MNETKFTPEDIAKNKDLAALSYVWVFSVIVLLARRDSAFARFHAKQGFVLFLCSLALWPLEAARFGEYLILPLMVLGFIQAAQGQAYGIPVRKFFHDVFHGMIRVFKPTHVTPELRQELHQDEQEFMIQKRFIDDQAQLQDREDKKISALINRLESDEKEIQHMKEELHQVEEKVGITVER